MITKHLVLYGHKLEVTLPEDVWEQISEQQLAHRHGIKIPSNKPAPVKKVPKK